MCPTGRAARRPFAALAVVLCAQAAGAQVRAGPQGYQQLTAAEVAESLAVLRRLNEVVHKYPDSAAVWYHRGMLAWTLAARDNVPPPIRGLDWTLLGHMADTSLRRAAQLAPVHIEYKLAAGRYLASSFGGVNRTASMVQYRSAVKYVRTIADGRLHSEAALQAGRLYFRLYDSKEHTSLASDDPTVIEATRRRPGGVPPPSVEEVSALLNRTLTAHDFPGEYYYMNAEALFNEASAADPSSSGVFRALAMVYAARNRWSELAALGRRRVRVAASDPWGWMALGLGAYKAGDPTSPAIAFDSALAHVDPATRGRLDHVERVMRPADSLKLSKMNPQNRAASERLYWLLADPLWSVPGNEPRVEFLARLAYADFRWTSPDLNEVGTETDRGNTYIRYGPPLSIMTAERPPIEGPPYGVINSFWNFRGGLPSVEFVGTERLHFGEPDLVGEMINETPVRWDNITHMRIDSMPTQVARFRTARDSVDVIIAQAAQSGEIEHAADVKGPALANVWLMRGGIALAAHDSARIGELGWSAFTMRVAPGNYVYRAEVSADGARRALRATGIVVTGADTAGSGFSHTGFGMSDVLLALSAEPRVPLTQRWSDFAVVPMAGPLIRDVPLSLVWENYELGSDDGTAHYGVTITIARERSQPGRIVAGIVRGIQGAVGVDQSPDRTEIRFERSVPHAAALVDNLTLSLGETPVGKYSLTVRIDDRVTGKTAMWTRSVSLEER